MIRSTMSYHLILSILSWVLGSQLRLGRIYGGMYTRRISIWQAPPLVPVSSGSTRKLRLGQLRSLSKSWGTDDTRGKWKVFCGIAPGVYGHGGVCCPSRHKNLGKVHRVFHHCSHYFGQRHANLNDHFSAWIRHVTSTESHFLGFQC